MFSHNGDPWPPLHALHVCNPQTTRPSKTSSSTSSYRYTPNEANYSPKHSQSFHIRRRQIKRPRHPRISAPPRLARSNSFKVPKPLPRQANTPAFPGVYHQTPNSREQEMHHMPCGGIPQVEPPPPPRKLPPLCPPLPAPNPPPPPAIYPLWCPPSWTQTSSPPPAPAVLLGYRPARL